MPKMKEKLNHRLKKCQVKQIWNIQLTPYRSKFKTSQVQKTSNKKARSLAQGSMLELENPMGLKVNIFQMRYCSNWPQKMENLEPQTDQVGTYI